MNMRSMYMIDFEKKNAHNIIMKLNEKKVMRAYIFVVFINNKTINKIAARDVNEEKSTVRFPTPSIQLACLSPR